MSFLFGSLISVALASPVLVPAAAPRTLWACTAAGNLGDGRHTHWSTYGAASFSIEKAKANALESCRLQGIYNCKVGACFDENDFER